MTQRQWIFCVPFPPKGAGRHRSAVVDGHIHNYKDPTTERWQYNVGMVGARVLPREPFECPLEVCILAVLARPKYLLKRSKRTGELLGGAVEGLMWAPCKPDRDNIDKGVLDALKGCWRDDAQAVAGPVWKCYAEATGKPRLVVRIREVAESPYDVIPQEMIAAEVPF